MFPLLTRSIVEMQLSSVVFPDPLGPMIATNSPFSTDSEMPLSALVSENALP